MCGQANKSRRVIRIGGVSREIFFLILAMNERKHSRDSIENSYTKHQRLIDIYRRQQFTDTSSHPTTELFPEDLDALRRNHQFVRDDTEDEKLLSKSWEVRMARKYYNRLFKEYAVGDFSRYKEGKIGLRWRVEREVMSGKGQFTCGSLSCSETDHLNSYEVPFRYSEGGVIKHELVKIRVCEECAIKLFYKKTRSQPIEKQKEKSRKRAHEESPGDREERKNRRRQDSSTRQANSPNSSQEISVKDEPAHLISSTTADPKLKDTFGMEDYLKDLFF
jgi:protein FRA10AC1